MIRQAIDCDIPDILRMAADFWKHTDYSEPFDHAHVANAVQNCMSQGLVAVIDENGLVGFCAATMFPLLGSIGAMMATELAWWIDPNHRKGRKGLELMRFMESLARERGVKYFNMIAMESSSPETAEKIYLRTGYRKAETTYTKVL